MLRGRSSRKFSLMQESCECTIFLETRNTGAIEKCYILYFSLRDALNAYTFALINIGVNWLPHSYLKIKARYSVAPAI